MLVVTWRRLERHAPRHASWNQTLGDGELFPYLAIEHQPQLLASLLRQQQGDEVRASNEGSRRFHNHGEGGLLGPSLG